MESDLDIWSKYNILYDDIRQYRRMIIKLIYLTINMLEISVVGLPNQFIYNLGDVQWKAILRI